MLTLLIEKKFQRKFMEIINWYVVVSERMDKTKIESI